jgi:hypothetical protein
MIYKVSIFTINNPLDFLHLLKSPPSITLILTITAIYFFAKSIADKYKTQKNKFEELRKETINKLTSHWENNQRSDKKDLISEKLSKLGINIRHIN